MRLQVLDILGSVGGLVLVIVLVTAGGLLMWAHSSAGSSVPWPDDAELFLAWQTTERAASAAARQLNAWEAAHQPLHLLCATACATVLADHENRRLTLPTLSPLGGGGRATHPGRR